MRFFKKFFFFGIFAFLLTSGVHAGPKRFFGGEPKNDPSALTTAEQTAFNREQEERRESTEEGKESEEDRLSVKKSRGATIPQIVEGSSQAVSEAPLETQVQASSSAAAYPVIPIRLLWTTEPPTLYRLALERVMKLPPGHPVFYDGLPLQLHNELIEPYYKAMREMIQELHKVCQQYALYRLPKEVKQKEEIVILKQYLQEKLAACTKDLRTKNYPRALLQIDNTKIVFSEFQVAIQRLKEREGIRKEARLAVQSNKSSRGKEGLLSSLMQSLLQHTQTLQEVVKEKRQLAMRLLLQDPSAAEVECFRQSLARRESKLAKVTSCIEQQKIFLARSEQATPEQILTMQKISQECFEILNLLDKASMLRDREGDKIVNAQLNACDQMMKAFVSTDPQVKRMQEKIININCILASLTSRILEAKIEQRNIILAREGRLTTFKDGSVKAQPESDTPIFNLYEIPFSFLEKNLALLEQAKADYIAGKKTSATIKSYLAERWKFLARGKADSVNLLSQFGLIVDPENFLTPQEIVARNQLILKEQQLTFQSVSLPVDREIASLPWDFEKTFEENVAALHRFEL